MRRRLVPVAEPGITGSGNYTYDIYKFDVKATPVGITPASYSAPAPTPTQSPAITPIARQPTMLTVSVATGSRSGPHSPNRRATAKRGRFSQSNWVSKPSGAGPPAPDVRAWQVSTT